MLRLPRWLKGLFVGLATGLVGVALVSTPPGSYFEENVGLAWLFRMRGTVQPPPNMAIVAINERAVEGLGLPRLPRDWPRSIHARLIENLVDRGASAIVFDLDFQKPKAREHDLAFARAAAEADRVVLFQRLSGRGQPIFDADGRQSGTVWTEQLISPTAEIAQSAKALGPFPVPKVQVNVFQFWAFKPTVGDAATLPAVALQVHALKLYDSLRKVLERAGAPGMDELPRRGRDISRAEDVSRVTRALRQRFRSNSSLVTKIDRLLAQGEDAGLSAGDRGLLKSLARLYAGPDQRYLNFYGPPGTVPNIPYSAVINGAHPHVDPAALDFSNKVVFVGFSDLFDPGQPDRFFTVFTRDDGVDLSGVEIIATAFGNLLTDRTLKPADTVTTIVLLLGFGTILGVTVYLLTALVGVPAALSIGASYLFAAQYAFNTADLWLPVATPILVQLPLAVFIGLLGQFLLERHRQKVYSKAVSYYLPDDVARELTDKELDPSSLNRVVYGACLATDMSGFTAISETMPPDELAAFMNAYFDELAEALRNHGVDVTEFHADAIMCAWTADDPDALERRRVILASLAVVDAVNRFSARVRDVDLNGRVGLDEGQLYVGHTGGGGRMGYSIVGDCANTASRLEGLNKHLGTHILATRQMVKNAEDLLLRPLGSFNLVGKGEPSEVVEILGLAEDATESEHRSCARFAEALGLYRQQRWSAAAERYASILHDDPGDGPSAFYLARCRAYQTETPSEDDPTIVYMESK